MAFQGLCCLSCCCGLDLLCDTERKAEGNPRKVCVGACSLPGKSQLLRWAHLTPSFLRPPFRALVQVSQSPSHHPLGPSALSAHLIQQLLPQLHALPKHPLLCEAHRSFGMGVRWAWGPLVNSLLSPALASSCNWGNKAGVPRTDSGTCPPGLSALGGGDDDDDDDDNGV